MTTQKPTSKRKDVIPSAWHVDNPDYVGYITIGGDSFYTDYFKTKEEAYFALEKLAYKHSYDQIETVEGEGCYPERAKIMNERYKELGRDAKDHPMHGLFTGIAKEYGEISDDNPS
tara:strand:+ start:41 stop:388 length:348 start_codon:yes stop_codon:yes gene_type:complete